MNLYDYNWNHYDPDTHIHISEENNNLARKHYVNPDYNESYTHKPYKPITLHIKKK